MKASVASSDYISTIDRMSVQMNPNTTTLDPSVFGPQTEARIPEIVTQNPVTNIGGADNSVVSSNVTSNNISNNTTTNITPLSADNSNGSFMRNGNLNR
jgi:hypothetical protein